MGVFQSTLPAREATVYTNEPTAHLIISIHASREGSDLGILQNRIIGYGISIHASREGSDITLHRGRAINGNFNPRFPRGKRQFRNSALLCFRDFNPRFPRGKRPPMEQTRFSDYAFQSTLPAREATSNSASVIFL